jgi:hypothetical protein
MRYAQISNNQVVNIIEADTQAIADSVSHHDIVIQSDDANNNWIYDAELGLRDNPQPSFDAFTHEVTLTAREGQVPHWVSTELSSDVISERLAQASADVRNERDVLLAATDWTASTDVTMSTAMATYRQALRDVPEQAGFPSEITWPTKP